MNPTLIARAACRICSRPDCRAFTLRPSPEDASIDVDTGVVVELPDGGLFLCAECAEEVERDPAAHPTELLVRWRDEHRDWTRRSLNLRSAPPSNETEAFETPLAEELAGADPERFDLVRAADPEALRVASALKRSLAGGGWTLVDEFAAPGELEVPGVVLHIRKGDELRPGVAALIRRLREFGLLTYCKRWDQVERIRLDVGRPPASGS